MAGILDTILDNHDNARIASQEHNTDNVNYGGESAIRSSRPSGSWDAAEYGISLNEAQARWDAAQTPEAREKVIADLKARALRRAGLDTTGGRVRVMSAGSLPWHGLGVVVESAVTSADAIRLAGLDWPVDKVTLTYAVGAGEGQMQRTAPDVFGIVRRDTGEMLGNVGSRYTPIQNAEGFDFLDGVLAEFGAKYETAGSLYNGSKVWMLAHLPQQDFTVNGGDEQKAYVLFENVHDGSGSAACYPTAVRVVCANTLRMASRDNGKGLSIRHTGNVKDKIRAAQSVLGVAVRDFTTYKEQAETLYHKPLEITHYANDVLDACLEITQAEVNAGANILAASIAKTEAERAFLAKSFARKIERRGEILDDILTRYESERCGVGSIRGTAWAAFNAVTEHADHARTNRQSRDEQTRLSRRFESSISGDADTMKQTALEIALKA